MRYRTPRVSIALVMCFVATLLPGDGLRSVRGAGAANLPTMIYVSNGRLWIQPVEGGYTQLVGTDWPMRAANGLSDPAVQWSPDGKRIAYDDGGARLAVFKLNSGRTTLLLGRRCIKNCAQPVYSWSPNGRYLAMIQYRSQSSMGTLSIWDSRQGIVRRLIGNIAAFTTVPTWSHDGTRIAVSTGPFDTIKSVFPNLVTVDLAGHMMHLGKGTMAAWSPDDRLIGAIRPTMCGANTCDEYEVVVSSTTGAVALRKYSTSLFDNPIWGRWDGGYAFDRWLLNRSGHITRQLAGPRERIIAWQPSGAHVALQTYYPYQGTPDVLSVSTPTHQRVRIYQDGPNSGCGACSKDVYRVSWSRSGAIFALVTPTYPTPKGVIVKSRVLISPIVGGALTRIHVPGSDYLDVLGFVNDDQTVVIRSGRSVYRYTIATHRLTRIVAGAGYNPGTPALDSTLLAP